MSLAITSQFVSQFMSQFVCLFVCLCVEFCLALVACDALLALLRLHELRIRVGEKRSVAKAERARGKKCAQAQRAVPSVCLCAFVYLFVCTFSTTSTVNSYQQSVCQSVILSVSQFYLTRQFVCTNIIVITSNEERKKKKKKK